MAVDTFLGSNNGLQIHKKKTRGWGKVGGWVGGPRGQVAQGGALPIYLGRLRPSGCGLRSVRWQHSTFARQRYCTYATLLLTLLLALLLALVSTRSNAARHRPRGFPGLACRPGRAAQAVCVPQRAAVRRRVSMVRLVAAVEVHARVHASVKENIFFH